MTYRTTLGIVLLLTAAAWAVSPQTWEHQTEADFSGGKLDAAVVTSYGEVKLARKVEVLMKSEDAPVVVSDVVSHAKALYAADGAGNGIYRIADGKSEKFAEVPSTMIACLRPNGRDLLVGTGGDGGGVYRVNRRGRTSKVWTDPDVTYVWAIVPDGKGGFYAATGTKAGVYHVNRNGRGRKLYGIDKLAKNILCLALDAGNDTLYAGTDEAGLILAIQTNNGKGRVLYDAPEKEIAAVVADPHGGVYAATSDASKAKADGDVEPSTEKEGKAVPPSTAPDVSKEEAERIDEALDAVPVRKNAGKSDEKPDTKAEDSPAETGKPENGAKEESAEGKRPTRRVRKAMRKARKAATQPADNGKATPAAKASPRATPSGAASQPSSSSNGRPTSASGKATGPGNAVYYVRPTGVVETVFRRPVTVLDMAMHKGQLLLATGNGGAVYAVRSDGDLIVKLADVESSQVTSLAAGKGAIVFATANKGSVAKVAESFAPKGTLVSKALDAKQIALWGTVKLQADAPHGTRVTIATRSGNLSEPDDNTWSEWSKEIPAGDGFVKIPTPAGRFLQYRVTLSSGGHASPTLRGLKIVHQVGNLAPSISAVTVKVGPKGGGTGPVRVLQVKAADENGDRLLYRIAYRKVGEKLWTELADELDKPQYVWNTQTVGDGAYELRIEASDEKSNAPKRGLSAARVSEPVLVDNTAPQIAKLAGRVGADGKVTLTGQATDRISRITSIEYAVDSGEWQTALPTDNICDQLSEMFRIELTDLEAGAHRIAVRVTDKLGNSAHDSVVVKVEK
ncbi:MAG: hypothetical protein ACLFV7_07070 [Phycisphaerae bacterium]